jgi:hypothetical protein
MSIEEKKNVTLDPTKPCVSAVWCDDEEIRRKWVSREEFNDLLERVKYIERKLGIVSGV